MIQIRIAILLVIAATLITVVLMGLVVIANDKEQKEVLGCGVVDSYGYCGNVGYETIDHPGRAIFESNCKVCHRLDQKLVGPALRNVFDLRDSVWIYKFTRNGEAMKESGDSLAVAIDEEYNHTVHTNFESLSDSSMNKLMVYLQLVNEQN